MEHFFLLGGSVDCPYHLSDSFWTSDEYFGRACAELICAGLVGGSAAPPLFHLFGVIAHAVAVVRDHLNHPWYS